jgi:NADH:ubiquinone reductase (H+-translocating)
LVERKNPLVVVVGAGFAGLNAARELRKTPVDLLLVDKNNYHLFQPLLYQVATAGLSAEEIAYPVRSILRKQTNAQFRLAEVTGVDFANRKVETSTGALPYDYLILAVGGETNFFGLDSVVRHGFELKDLDHAESLRNHILTMFELATHEEDEETRQALLTFVVVGGGPTGVESAGAFTELVRLVLDNDFPQLEPSQVRLVILEMLDTLLPGFPQELGETAQEMLNRKGVEVRLNETVTDYDGRRIQLKSGETILAHSLLWAVGVKAVELIDTLGVEQAKQGRVVVERTLQLPDHPNVLVIGDAAYLEGDGKPLPLVAPVAIQQAKVAAENIRRMLKGESLVDFEYRDPGSLATIGKSAAVAQIGRFKFSGFLAWIIWLAVHLFWLIGFRNRLIVLINWAWDYLFYERAIRLITPYSRRQSEIELEKHSQR